jgi:WD40 repeat protein
MLLLKGHQERVRGLSYSPDGTALASCGSDLAVRLWDLVSGTERLVMRGHRGDVLGVVFSPDGCRLASVGSEPSLRVWDAVTGARRAAFDLSPTGRDTRDMDWFRAFVGRRLDSQAEAPQLCAAVAAGWRLSRTRARRLGREAAALWRFQRLTRTPGEPDKMDHGEIFEMTLGAQTLSVFVPASARGTFRGTFVPGCGFSLGVCIDLEVAFSPDGQTLALTAEKFVHLWDRDRRRLTILEGHEAKVWSLAFAPDGRSLATGGHDGTVRLWEVPSGEERACLDGDVGIIDAVAFSPDGMTVAAGGAKGIVVWDVEERWG